MIVYHASPHKYDFPDYDKLVENRENHDNGNLGLWCAVSDHWIKGFGEHIYAVHLDMSKPYDVTVSELRDIANDTKCYQKKRQQLLDADHQILRVIERHGECDMLVVMDFDAILSFKLIEDFTL